VNLLLEIWGVRLAELSVVGAATLCMMKNTSATSGTAQTTILFRDNGRQIEEEQLQFLRLEVLFTTQPQTIV